MVFNQKNEQCSVTKIRWSNWYGSREQDLSIEKLPIQESDCAETERTGICKTKLERAFKCKIEPKKIIANVYGTINTMNCQVMTDMIVSNSLFLHMGHLFLVSEKQASNI